MQSAKTLPIDGHFFNRRGKLRLLASSIWARPHLTVPDFWAGWQPPVSN